MGVETPFPFNISIEHEGAKDSGDALVETGATQEAGKSEGKWTRL
jgi:hypothetical protein